MAIENKVIVITGASSGIGRSAAELLASRGAIVVLGARSVGGLASVAEGIQATGGRVAYLPTDVTRQRRRSLSMSSIPACISAL